MVVRRSRGAAAASTEASCEAVAGGCELQGCHTNLGPCGMVQPLLPPETAKQPYCQSKMVRVATLTGLAGLKKKSAKKLQRTKVSERERESHGADI